MNILQIFKEKYEVSETKLREYIEFVFEKKCEYSKGKTAIHHILPQALFPKYKKLKENKWNGICLSNDDHYIAHKMLFELIPNVSTASAWYGMNNCNYKNNEPIKMIGKEKYSELIEMRNRICSKHAKNKVMCKDKLGNTFKVSKSEFDKTDDLVGITNGKMLVTKRDDGSKIMIETKNYNKNNHLFHTTNTVTIKNKDGSFSRVSKNIFDNDEQMVGSTKNLTIFKNSKGEVLQLDINDSRVKSGEFVGYMKGSKRTAEQNKARSEYLKNNPHKHPLAKIIVVFDKNEKLIFVAHGNFKKMCKEHNLPIRAFTESYQTNTKINEENKEFKRKCDKTRYNNNKYKMWYAKEISKEELSKIIV